MHGAGVRLKIEPETPCMLVCVHAGRRVPLDTNLRSAVPQHGVRPAEADQPRRAGRELTLLRRCCYCLRGDMRGAVVGGLRGLRWPCAPFAAQQLPEEAAEGSAA